MFSEEFTNLILYSCLGMQKYDLHNSERIIKKDFQEEYVIWQMMDLESQKRFLYEKRKEYMKRNHMTNLTTTLYEVDI